LLLSSNPAPAQASAHNIWTTVMIAIIKYAYNWVVDSAKFASAVWHDARAMQHEAEAKYGHISF
jgi:hypothetical protein